MTGGGLVRLRQVVLAADDLDRAVDELCAVLGIEVSYRDPGVEIFGLRNAVMPVGDTFLEVVSPIAGDAPARRYLERRGAGGYMLMVQTGDFDGDRARLDGLGVRVVWEIALDDIRGMHLHPRDTGGALLSIDQPADPAAWRWAGPDWPSRARTRAVTEIVAAELQSDDAEELAERWARVLGRTAQRGFGAAMRIPLDRGELRYVVAGDGRGEGLGGFAVRCADRAAVVAAARQRGLEPARDDGSLLLAGARVTLL